MAPPAGVLESLFPTRDSAMAWSYGVLLLGCAWPGQKTMCPSGSPQAFTSSLLQVTTLSDLQPYMGQFLKHLQDSDASALRNSVVIEQVLGLPINGPHLGGAFHLYLAICLVQECDQHAPW